MSCSSLRSRILLLVVAVLVTACSGDGGGGGGSATASEGTVEVTAGDLWFEPETITAEAGALEVTLVNEGSVEHDLVVEETGDTVVVGLVPGGGSASGTIELDAGAYTFYCSVPGHRNSMQGTIEVR